MSECKLKLKSINALPVIVPSYSVETYFAIGEEQAKRDGLERCIHPELPDHHHVYSAMHNMPDTLYEERVFEGGSTVWKFRKDRIEEVMEFIGIGKKSYPYEQALDMIEGEFFWIIAWDD